MPFDRSKIVAIVTGFIALALGISYLILVQILDARGGMQPAPPGLTIHVTEIGIFFSAFLVRRQ